MRLWIAALAFALLALPVARAQQTYSFEPSEYQKKDYEIGGFAEGKLEGFALNRGGAFYQLNKPSGSRPSVNERGTGTLEVTGKYHKDIVSLNVTAHGDGYRDVVFGNNHSTKLYEAGLALQPETGLSLDIGKKVVLWGKGYAWNPVAFIERPKDASDTLASREGYAMASTEWVRSFEGSLRTVSVTPTMHPR